jgi:hypothetical protein
MVRVDVGVVVFVEILLALCPMDAVAVTVAADVVVVEPVDAGVDVVHAIVVDVLEGYLVAFELVMDYEVIVYVPIWLVVID